MTLAATGTLETVTKIQYLRTLVCGEALHQFDLLSSDLEMMETLNTEYIIKVLELYSPPVNLLLKKRVMRPGIKNTV